MTMFVTGRRVAVRAVDRRLVEALAREAGDADAVADVTVFAASGEDEDPVGRGGVAVAGRVLEVEAAQPRPSPRSRRRRRPRVVTLPVIAAVVPLPWIAWIGVNACSQTGPSEKLNA